MSVNTIEGILWNLGEHRDLRRAYLKDPDAYLRQFPLGEDEVRMVRMFDLQALEGAGVSNMLLMNTWNAVNGGNPLLIFEFLRKINGGTLTNQMKIRGWQFAMVRLALAVRRGWLGLLCAVGLRKKFS